MGGQDHALRWELIEHGGPGHPPRYRAFCACGTWAYEGSAVRPGDADRVYRQLFAAFAEHEMPG